MRNKVLKIFGLLAMVVPLAACGTQPTPAPTHSHSCDTWSKDETNHWHECKECHERYDVNAHNLVEEVITAPTCTVAGSTKISCSVCDYSTTKTVEALGHDLKEVEYVWTALQDGGYKCTAATSCKRTNCTYSITEEVNAAYEVVTDPLCTEVGQGKYTATFENEKFEQQVKLVEIPAKGHIYGAATYTWTESGDTYTVAASKSCACGDEKTATATSVTSIVTKEAKCNETGERTWTAVFGDGSEFASATKVTTIAKIPHTTGDWQKDDTNHWHVCSVCEEQVDKVAHTFVNGECSVCNQRRTYTSLEDIVKSTDTSKKYSTVGYVTSLYKNNSYQGVWIADGEYGIQVYGFNNNNLNPGDLVEVVNAGYIRDTSKRYIELTQPSVIAKLTAEPTFFDVDEPVDYTIGADWSTCTKSIDNNTTLNRPVTFEGTLLTRPETITKSSDSTLTGLDKSGQTVTIYLKKTNVADNVYEEFNKLKAGDKIKVSGVVGTYSGNTQIIVPGVPEVLDSAVASITTGSNTKYYFSMVDAVADVPTDGTATTIELMRDEPKGQGIVVNQGQNIVFDLNSHTYTVKAPAVGSAGTTTSGFQLLEGSQVKFKDGTVNCYDTTDPSYVPVEKDRICQLIQNYSNLTLENAIIDHTKGKDAKYAVSNNFGSLTLDATSKIIAAEGKVAFDMWYGMSPIYEDGITVSVPSSEEFEANIVGKIEYGRDNHSAKYDANWFNRTAVSMDGKNYRVKNELLPAKGAATSFANFGEFKDALVEITIVLQSIAVNAGEAKTEFKVGETFSSTGLVVSATYDDESTKAVSGFTTDMDGKTFALADIADGKTVTVSYTEGETTKTATYTINVKDNALTTDGVRALEAAGTTETIQGNVIAISKKAFVVADATGLMQVWMNAAPSVTMDKYVRVTGKTEDRSGARQLTNTPTIADGIGTDPQIKPTAVEMTTEQWDDANIISEGPVLVKGVVEVYSTGSGYNFYYLGQGESLEAAARATNTGYNYQATTSTDFCVAGNEGKFFDVVGVVVQISSAKNRCFMPISYETHKIATTSIDFTVNGGTEAVSLKPNGTATLAAVCNPAGASQEVEYVVTGDDGVVSIEGNTLTALKAGTVTVKAKQGTLESTNSVEITVENLTVSSIEITGTMTKTSYSVGDDWDPKGLVVTATYSDSSTAVVTDNVEWSYNPAKADATTTTSVAVTASFGGQTDTENVAVTIINAVTMDFNKNTYDIGTTSGTFTFTAGGVACKGEKINIFSSGKSNQALFLTSGTGFIYNTAAFESDIKSIQIFTNTGSSGSANYYVQFGTSALSSYQNAGEGCVIGAGANHTYECSTAGARYFNLSLKSKNGQVTKIVITLK